MKNHHKSTNIPVFATVLLSIGYIYHLLYTTYILPIGCVFLAPTTYETRGSSSHPATEVMEVPTSPCAELLWNYDTRRRFNPTVDGTKEICGTTGVGPWGVEFSPHSNWDNSSYLDIFDNGRPVRMALRVPKSSSCGVKPGDIYNQTSLVVVGQYAGSQIKGSWHLIFRKMTESTNCKFWRNDQISLLLSASFQASTVEMVILIGDSTGLGSVGLIWNESSISEVNFKEAYIISFLCRIVY